MRVKGPVDGAPRVAGPRQTAPAEAAARPSAAEAVSNVAAPVAAGAIDPIAEVAARLRTGEITAAQALDLLIDDAVGRQVGRAVGERRALADELKLLLRRQTETDPYLASKMRRLRNRK